MILDKLISVDVLPTTAIWYGITYREDKEEVVQNINKLINQGEYPNNLWQ